MFLVFVIDSNVNTYISTLLGLSLLSFSLNNNLFKLFIDFYITIFTKLVTSLNKIVIKLLKL